MKRSRPRLARARQRGATLVEVLVTMLVIALGLLGFAGLQTATMKNNRVSLYRGYATLHAHHIIDCMRANRANATAYVTSLSASPVASPATVAGRDISDWLTALAADLPDGDGSVALASGVVTVTVQWDEGGTAQSFKTESSLRP